MKSQLLYFKITKSFYRNFRTFEFELKCAIKINNSIKIHYLPTYDSTSVLNCLQYIPCTVDT